MKPYSVRRQEDRVTITHAVLKGALNASSIYSATVLNAQQINRIVVYRIS